MVVDPRSAYYAEYMIRTMLSVRINQPGIDWLDEKAEEHRVTRSEILRGCFAVAKQHPEFLDKVITGMKEQL